VTRVSNPWYEMKYLPAAFSLLVLAAGWYYLFYSPAAHRLSGIEQPQLNALRIRLRRANGVVMMLLAVAFYAACETVNEFTSKSTAILVLVSVPLLLCAMIVLALIDIRLTRRLQRDRKRNST
jgi:hypothetical protein